MLRLVIGPSPRKIQLPADYRLTEGRGVVLSEGEDAVILAYGPVMLHEALLASELLQAKDFGLKVVNMPWLNRSDTEWLDDVVGPVPTVYVLEDHAPVGGLGDSVLNALSTSGLLKAKAFKKLAVEGYPVWGTPREVLPYHGLDGASIARTALQDHGCSK